MTPFKDSPQGQTHYENDGCGMPEHNHFAHARTMVDRLVEDAKADLVEKSDHWWHVPNSMPDWADETIRRTAKAIADAMMPDEKKFCDNHEYCDEGCCFRHCCEDVLSELKEKRRGVGV